MSFTSELLADMPITAHTMRAIGPFTSDAAAIRAAARLWNAGFAFDFDPEAELVEIEHRDGTPATLNDIRAAL